jgi:hypothetical protein
MMLKRYWFIIYPDFKYGPRNIGVSALSISEAKKIILETMTKLNWNHISATIIENAEIIENIDIRLLDQGHVIPNMGPVVFEGVWFPFRNL